ncbi:TPR-like protein [Aspergillus unguis]
MEVIGGISAVIGLLDTSIDLFKRTQKDLKLSETIETVGRQLPIIRNTLEQCQAHLLPRRDTIPEDVAEALEKTLDTCEIKANNLKKIFAKITPDQGDSWPTRYAAVVRRLGKGSKVEELMRAITEDVQIVVNHHAAPEDFSFHEPAGICLGRAPFIDTELFIGRQKELKAIMDTLQPACKSPEQQRLVLGGIGGIGKTQLAIKYAKCHQNSYTSVFWLNAESEAALRKSFLSIAKQIFKLQQPDQLKDKEAVIHVCQWLSDPKNHQWLLILDNYDDPREYDIEQYYPPASHGVLLITSRQPNLVAGKRIMVQPLKHIDGLEILHRRSERVNTHLDPHARLLAERLAGLPLALATAGAFLRHSTLAFADYLEEYEKRWIIDPHRSTQLKEYQNRTLFTTWDLSYTRLQAYDPEAAELLGMLAYFGNESLWYELFNAGLSDSSPEWLREVVHNRISLDGVMKTLADYCFLEVHTQSSFWSMHTCVHDWTLTVLNMTINTEKYWYAFNCVAGSIPSNSTKFLGHPSFSGVVVHATRLIHPRFFQAGILDDVKESQLADISLIASLLHEQLQFVAAERMCQKVLEGREKALSSNHPSTLDTVNNLGLLYYKQGKLKEVEVMYQRALAGYKKALGPVHTSTLNTVNNLGNLYSKQGKLKEAEQMYQHALEGYKKVLGPNHTTTLATVNNLGNLYSMQGKLKEAEERYQHALAGYKKALGPNPTSTLDTVNNLGINNLGSLYKAQGKLKEAEQMYQHALAGKEKALGPDHTSTLSTVNNLGNIYKAQGRLKEAEEMYQHALAGYEKALGPEHPKTSAAARALSSLASFSVE